MFPKAESLNLSGLVDDPITGPAEIFSSQTSVADLTERLYSIGMAQTVQASTTDDDLLSNWNALAGLYNNNRENQQAQLNNVITAHDEYLMDVEGWVTSFILTEGNTATDMQIRQQLLDESRIAIPEKLRENHQEWIAHFQSGNEQLRQVDRFLNWYRLMTGVFVDLGKSFNKFWGK